MTGPELTRCGRETLEAAGWLVKVFNYHRAMPTGLRGLPDMICWKADRTVLIEIKAPGDRVRPEQAEFARRIAEHSGPHLCYIVARGLGDFDWIVEASR